MAHKILIPFIVVFLSCIPLGHSAISHAAPPLDIKENPVDTALGKPVAAQTCSAVKVLLPAPDYDSAKNRYLLNLSIDCHQSVALLSVTVESESGVRIPTLCEKSSAENGCDLLYPESNQQVILSAAKFQAETSYTILIRAVDETNTLIQRLENRSGSDSDPTILAQAEFKHQPPLPSPIEILSIRIEEQQEKDKCGWIDEETRKLIVTPDISLEDNRIDSYRVHIEDQSTGQLVAGGEMSGEFTGSHIILPMPTAMREAAMPKEYLLTLTLHSETGGTSELKEKEFIITPPPTPALWERVICALTNQQLFLVGIAVVISSAAAVLFFGNRADTKQTEEFPRPPIDPTQYAPATPQIRVRLLSTQVEAAEDFVRDVPCVIGRHQGCEVALAAKQVSSRHLHITLEDHRFFMTDLDSKNGTFVGERQLVPNVPMQLIGITKVRLGQDTVLELEPIA